MSQRVFAIALLVVWAPVLAAAQLDPLGSEFQVNTYTLDDQESASICSDAAGNFVVVWMSYSYSSASGQDGDISGIFGQRYTREGTTLGSEFRVNTYTVQAQQFPVAACAASGAFVAVWSSYDQDGDSAGIFGQRYDSTGVASGTEFQVNSYTSTAQDYAAVASDAAGNFVVVWESYYQDGSGFGIFGQRFASGGAPLNSEFQINSWFTGQQRYPAVAADADGGFVVVWTGYDEDGNEGGIFGRRYDSSGLPATTEFQVNSYTPGRQNDPAIGAAADGAFVVVWVSYDLDSYSGGVFGQRFASTGARVGTEFQVSTFTEGSEYAPGVAIDPAGDFVVVWSTYYYFSPDGDISGVFARRFDSAGAPIGSDFQVNTYTSSYQSYPAISTQGGGRFVVVWQSGGDISGDGPDGSGFGIFGQRFVAPSPTPLLGDCNGDGRVTTNELVVAVSIDLGTLPLSDCTAIDGNMDDRATIDEIVGAVSNALTM